MKPTVSVRLLLFWLLLSGAAEAQTEFFLRVDDPGRYTVTLDDQAISLSSGRYRFFEVPAGRQRLVILRNSTTLYQDWVDLRPNSRTVAEFRARQGLRITAVSPLSGGSLFAGTDWTNPADAGRGVELPGSYEQRPALGAAEFGRIQEAVKKHPFDDGKFDLLRTILPDRALSADQLAVLLKLFTFDTKRLETAKIGWNSVTDRQNFYVVFEVFTFSTSVKELKTHIGSR